MSARTEPAMIALTAEHGIRRRYIAARVLVWFSLAVLGTDTAYKTYYGITYSVRENCIIYSSLPRWAFTVLEQVIELFLVVVAGVFAASLLEKHFRRLGRFVPRNPFTAFAAAALIPVCSCSAIPLVAALRDRASFATIITFVVAAPLLNPYIVVLSFSVLGPEYALWRIGGSMLLAIATGYIAQIAQARLGSNLAGLPPLPCGHKGCFSGSKSPYEMTLDSMGRLAPYLLVAGLFGLAVSWWGPDRLLFGIDMKGNLTSTMAAILIGVPIYFCNGADIIFLKPFLFPAYLPLGSAVAFSLTSTSVCATSLILLARYVGKLMTGIILGTVVLLTLLISLMINLVAS